MHAVKVKVGLTITNPITSNSFCSSLADLRVGYSYLHGGTLYASSIITSIMQYSSCSQCPVFLFIFSSSSLDFLLARNVFHLFPCNFTRICFVFLKKTLWFFPMLFYGNPTHFIPVSELFYLCSINTEELFWKKFQ